MNVLKKEEESLKSSVSVCLLKKPQELAARNKQILEVEADSSALKAVNSNNEAKVREVSKAANSKAAVVVKEVADNSIIH